MQLLGRLCVLAVLVLPGCGGPGSDLPMLPNVGSASYRLGAGDQVRIITFGEENLTGEFRVNNSGNGVSNLADGANSFNMLLTSALDLAKSYGKSTAWALQDETPG